MLLIQDSILQLLCTTSLLSCCCWPISALGWIFHCPTGTVPGVVTSVSTSFGLVLILSRGGICYDFFKSPLFEMVITKWNFYGWFGWCFWSRKRYFEIWICFFQISFESLLTLGLLYCNCLLWEQDPNPLQLSNISAKIMVVIHSPGGLTL